MMVLCDCQAEPRTGRETMRKGMEFIRSVYPDISFRVTDMCACTSSDKVRSRLFCVYRYAMPVFS